MKGGQRGCTWLECNPGKGGSPERFQVTGDKILKDFIWETWCRQAAAHWFAPPLLFLEGKVPFSSLWIQVGGFRSQESLCKTPAAEDLPPPF